MANLTIRTEEGNQVVKLTGVKGQLANAYANFPAYLGVLMDQYPHLKQPDQLQSTIDKLNILLRDQGIAAYIEAGRISSKECLAAY